MSWTWAAEPAKTPPRPPLVVALALTPTPAFPDALAWTAVGPVAATPVVVPVAFTATGPLAATPVVVPEALTPKAPAALTPVPVQPLAFTPMPPETLP